MGKKDLESNWYVLKIVTKYEKNIIYNINKILKKYNVKNYKIYNFFKVIVKYRNTKKYIQKKYLLPGYLIINLVLNYFILYKIKKIKGVIYFLNERINKLPIPLNYIDIQKFIKNIKKNNILDNININNKININIGDNIKVIKGILNGLLGVVNKIYNKEKKILLNTYIMGRRLSIKIDKHLIEKI